jgi:hypothetical protein
MFPPLLIALRNATIRYGDLAVRALTLETVQLPDRMFAPVSAVSGAIAAPPACESRVRDGHLTEARVRGARNRLAGRPQSVRPLTVPPVTVAARATTASRRADIAATSSLHRNAARRGVAAADGRLARPDTPAGRRRP